MQPRRKSDVAVALHPLTGWSLALLLMLAALLLLPQNAAARRETAGDPRVVLQLTDPARVTVIVPGRTMPAPNTPQPTAEPTQPPQPTAVPTQQPTEPPPPTAVPTQQPTQPPPATATAAPPQPTAKPTQQPTQPPPATATAAPPQPTVKPTQQPTQPPPATATAAPPQPTVQPTARPTQQPTQTQPTAAPTLQPTKPLPTQAPAQPTSSPVASPATRDPDQPAQPQPTAVPIASPAGATATPPARATSTPTALRTPIIRLPRPSASPNAPAATLEAAITVSAPTLSAPVAPAQPVVPAPDASATPQAVAENINAPVDAAPPIVQPGPQLEPEAAPPEEILEALPPEDPPAQSNLVYVFTRQRVDAKHTLIAGCVANIGMASEFNVNILLDLRTTRAQIKALRSGAGPAAVNARQANTVIGQLRPGEARQMDALIVQNAISLEDKHFRLRVPAARMLDARTLDGRVQLACAPRDLSAAAANAEPARFMIDGEAVEAEQVARVFASNGLKLRDLNSQPAVQIADGPGGARPNVSMSTLLSLLSSTLLLLGLIGAAFALRVLD